MGKRPNKDTPVVRLGKLRIGRRPAIAVDSLEWFTWLETAVHFYFEGEDGHFTARRERRQRGGEYWFAYRRDRDKLHNVYLGLTERLTLHRLQESARKLHNKIAGRPAMQTKGVKPGDPGGPRFSSAGE